MVYVRWPGHKRGYWCNTIYKCESEELLLEALIEQAKDEWMEFLPLGEDIPEPAFYKVKEVNYARVEVIPENIIYQ